MLRAYIVKFCILLFFGAVYSQNDFIQDSLVKKAKRLKFKNPEIAASYLKKGYEINLKEKDTAKAIYFLIEMSELYSHNVNYGKSYDGFWEALLLADKSKDSIAMSKIYHQLGWLYGFYKRDKEAVKKFDISNKIRNRLINKTNKDDMLSYIVSNYFAVINLYRDLKNYDKASVYLDSAYQFQNKIKDKPKSYYLEAEKGYLASISGDFNLALQQLNTAKRHFEVEDPSYLVIIEMFFGDVYKRMKMFDASARHYKKSLEISKKYNRHLNTDLIVYNSLSNLYLSQNNFEESYKYLEKEKTLNDKIFGRSSENSHHLLQIKDLYRIEKKRQDDIKNQERIKQLEHEDKIWLLKSVILGLTILFLLIYGYLVIKYMRNRHKLEKLNLKETQKIKTQKHKEIIELKNKELTQSALRLVEKDGFIKKIKIRLENQKEKIDVVDIKRILRLFEGTSNSNWKEFEARFTSINRSFYSNLKKHYPVLTQTDLRMCALVKLNFTSKDISKLLSISIESVHTSRHRLRKKLNLKRGDNLEEFMDKF